MFNRLQHVEGKLSDIAQKSGTQVAVLTATVQENGRVQNQIKKILRLQVMQQIMTACLQADSDRDFVLGPQEVKMLEVRLSNIPGIDFHKDNFEHFLQSDQGELTLADVCNIARHLDDESSIPQEQRLVMYATQKLVVKKRPTPFNMGSAVLDLIPGN